MPSLNDLFGTHGKDYEYDYDNDNDYDYEYDYDYDYDYDYEGYFVAFRCISLHSVAFRCISVHFGAFRCISVHFGAFRCISVYSGAFRCTGQDSEGSGANANFLCLPIAIGTVLRYNSTDNRLVIPICEKHWFV